MVTPTILTRHQWAYQLHEEYSEQLTYIKRAGNPCKKRTR